MYRIATAVAALVAVALLAQQATAASSTPLSLSLGVNFPSSSDAQDLGGTTQFAVNAAYSLTPASMHGGAFYIFLDYTGGSGATLHSPGGSTASGSMSSFGGGVGFRTTGRFYGGLDLGYYGTNASLSGEGQTFTSSGSGGGGRVYIGADLTRPGAAPVFYLETGYRFLPSVEGTSPSGFTVGLGARL